MVLRIIRKCVYYMKSLVTVLMFFGLLSVIVGYVHQIKKCPPPRVEYRYVPRTFEQEQDNPVKITELYHDMFSEPTPWVRGFQGSTSKDREINRYFVSQA